MRWLLDTNVLSELRKKSPSRAVVDWLESLSIETIFTSTLNMVELRYGAHVAAETQLRNEITLWIETRIRPMLGNRVLDVSENVLFRWRILSKSLEAVRKPAPPFDLMIAAVALENGLGIATRDTRPFISTGLPVFNPWTGKRFNGA
jgi:toxin FitB